MGSKKRLAFDLPKYHSANKQKEENYVKWRDNIDQTWDGLQRNVIYNNAEKAEGSYTWKVGTSLTSKSKTHANQKVKIGIMILKTEYFFPSETDPFKGESHASMYGEIIV